MRPTAYRRNARGLRDRQAFEGVRMQAGALFAANHSQAEVARTLGVARQNVSRWHARWRQGGLEGLRSAGPTGYAPRLSDSQLAAIDQALRQGARAHGFDTDHWTLARVATVIERLTGVSYHPGHVWWLLRRHDWSPQRPARRAAERDEDAIARWRAEDWPRIKGEIAVTEELGSEVNVIFHMAAPQVHHDVMIARFDKAAKDEVEAEELAGEGQSLWTARVNPKTQAKVGRSVDLAIDTGGFHFFDADSGMAIGRVAEGEGARERREAKTDDGSRTGSTEA